MERQTVTKIPKPATQKSSVQRQSAAPSSPGHRITQLQRSVGNHATQRLIRSPLIQAKLNVQRKCKECEEKEETVHAKTSAKGRNAAPAVGVNQPPVIARYAPIRIARVPCTSAAVCSPPTGVPGSARDFDASQEAEEASPRDRRKKMTPARAVSTGHAGRARQLENFLNAEQPGRIANIQGIFIDQDVASGTGAFNQSCAGWIAEALPAGAPTPPGMAGAVKKCVFVPANLNQEALEFNTTTNAIIGGKPRAVWRVKTLQSLIHETEHSRFNTATAGRALPAGVTSPTCTRITLRKELSEIAAMLSEFPPISRAAAAEASPTGPLHKALTKWFPFVFHPPGESIEGALSQMGCDCNCSEVTAFVADTFDEVTTSGGWTGTEKADFNAKARAELPPPGPPKWPL